MSISSIRRVSSPWIKAAGVALVVCAVSFAPLSAQEAPSVVGGWRDPPSAPVTPDSIPSRNLQQISAGDWGTLTAKLDLTPQERTDDDGLYHQQAWHVDDSWKYPVAGPVFLFGQLGANSDQAAQSDMKVATSGGLACKVAVLEQGEIVVRSGPSLSYSDPLRPDRTHEDSKWLLEVQGRWPLLARVGLEYQGTVSPALSPMDHNSINHDVRLAVPVGDNGKLRLGAKQSWQANSTDTARPWSTETEVYLGLELKR
jgi:hypothetical protein